METPTSPLTTSAGGGRKNNASANIVKNTFVVILIYFYPSSVRKIQRTLLRGRSIGVPFATILRSTQAQQLLTANPLYGFVGVR
jgi:hypothetical protein